MERVGFTAVVVRNYSDNIKLIVRLLNVSARYIEESGDRAEATEVFPEYGGEGGVVCWAAVLDVCFCDWEEAGGVELGVSFGVWGLMCLVFPFILRLMSFRSIETVPWIVKTTTVYV